MENQLLNRLLPLSDFCSITQFQDGIRNEMRQDEKGYLDIFPGYTYIDQLEETVLLYLKYDAISPIYAGVLYKLLANVLDPTTDPYVEIFVSQVSNIKCYNYMKTGDVVTNITRYGDSILFFNKNFPDWQNDQNTGTPYSVQMVPAVFNNVHFEGIIEEVLAGKEGVGGQIKGDKAEKYIFKKLQSVTCDAPQVIIHGFDVRQAIENKSDLRNQFKMDQGEFDFVVFHKTKGIFYFDAKSAKTLGKVNAILRKQFNDMFKILSRFNIPFYAGGLLPCINQESIDKLQDFHRMDLNTAYNVAYVWREGFRNFNHTYQQLIRTLPKIDQSETDALNSLVAHFVTWTRYKEVLLNEQIDEIWGKIIRNKNLMKETCDREMKKKAKKGVGRVFDVEMEEKEIKTGVYWTKEQRDTLLACEERIFISGRSGVGKTKLVAEIIRTILSKDEMYVVVICGFQNEKTAQYYRSSFGRHPNRLKVLVPKSRDELINKIERIRRLPGEFFLFIDEVDTQYLDLHEDIYRLAKKSWILYDPLKTKKSPVMNDEQSKCKKLSFQLRNTKYIRQYLNKVAERNVYNFNVPPRPICKLSRRNLHVVTDIIKRWTKKNANGFEIIGPIDRSLTRKQRYAIDDFLKETAENTTDFALPGPVVCKLSRKFLPQVRTSLRENIPEISNRVILTHKDAMTSFLKEVAESDTNGFAIPGPKVRELSGNYIHHITNLLQEFRSLKAPTGSRHRKILIFLKGYDRKISLEKFLSSSTDLELDVSIDASITDLELDVSIDASIRDLGLDVSIDENHICQFYYKVVIVVLFGGEGDDFVYIPASRAVCQLVVITHEPKPNEMLYNLLYLRDYKSIEIFREGIKEMMYKNGNTYLKIIPTNDGDIDQLIETVLKYFQYNTVTLLYAQLMFRVLADLLQIKIFVVINEINDKMYSLQFTPCRNEYENEVLYYHVERKTEENIMDLEVAGPMDRFEEDHISSVYDKYYHMILCPYEWDHTSANHEDTISVTMPNFIVRLISDFENEAQRNERFTSEERNCNVKELRNLLFEPFLPVTFNNFFELDRNLLQQFARFGSENIDADFNFNYIVFHREKGIFCFHENQIHDSKKSVKRQCIALYRMLLGVLTFTLQKAGWVMPNVPISYRFFYRFKNIIYKRGRRNGIPLYYYAFDSQEYSRTVRTVYNSARKMEQKDINRLSLLVAGFNKFDEKN